MEFAENAGADGVAEVIQESLLKMSQEMFTYMVSSIQLLAFTLGMIRGISSLLFGVQIQIKQIIGPIVFSAACYIFQQRKINKYNELSVITNIIKLALHLLFFDSMCTSTSNQMTMDTIGIIKIILLVDQFQLFPSKHQFISFCGVYLFVYARIVMVSESDILQPDKLVTLAFGIILSYFESTEVKGIKYFLLKYLGQVKKLENRWYKLLKNLKVGISIFKCSSLCIDFINNSMLGILDLQNGSSSQLVQQMQEITLLYKVQNEKQEVRLVEYLTLKFRQLREGHNELESVGETFKLKGTKKVIEITFQDCSQEDDLVLVMINDLTTVKKFEKGKQLNKMKQVYFCSVAHDLKTPITSIMATNEYLITRFQTEGPLMKHLKATKMSCFYLLRIIQDIMDLSNIEFNQFHLEYSWFSVKDLLQEVKEIMSFPFEMKRLEYNSIIISTTLNTHEAIIYSDPKRIKQILFNLIGNAHKFTLQGKVTVSVRLGEVNETEEDEKYEELKLQSAQFEERVLIFTVADTGVGIKDDNKKYLFKLFGKSSEQQVANKQGIGLGSTICKQLTEMLGGSISFVSEFGKGSTFTFSIRCMLKDQNFQTTCQNDCNLETDQDSLKFLLDEQYLKTQSFDLMHEKEKFIHN